MPRPFNLLFPLRCQSEDWQPVLQGATDNPSAVTYSKQSGVYSVIGNICFFNINVTTTSIAKTTLGDAVRISLPFSSANFPFTNHDVVCPCLVKNSVPVKNGNLGVIPKNSSYVEVHYDPSGSSAEQALTYGAGDLGVLTNTITMELSGWYFIAI